MIPAPYHFESITREAWVHPSVEAEIEAARRRSGVREPTRREIMGAYLRRMWPTARPLRRRRWLPAE